MYRGNLAHNRHIHYQQQLEDCPDFQPKLIAKNEAYLTGEEAEIRNKIGVSNHLYYEAMVSLVNKHSRVIEHEQYIQRTTGHPEIDEISKRIVENMED